MPCSQNSALCIVAGVFVILILGICLWPKCSTSDKAAVQLTKEKNVVDLASAPLPEDQKNFFSGGLGFMADMDQALMETAYLDYMTYSTGSGYATLTPIQISEEISRMQEDGKTSVGTEFRGEEEPEFDADAGYNVQAVGEVKNIRVKHPTTGKLCKYNTQNKQYSDCKAVQLNSGR